MKTKLFRSNSDGKKKFWGLRGDKLGMVMGLLAALGFALQGYDQAVANELLSLSTFIKIFPETDTVNTTGATKSQNSKVQGTTVAIYEIGCAIGALSCFYFGDILGRRKTIFYAGLDVLVGVIIQTSSFSLGQLIAGRIITGLGVGAFTATIPMWVSECMKAEKRGRTVLLQGWFAIIGVATATWLEFGLYFAEGNSVNWRFPIAFQMIYALGIVSVVFSLPESPRWLVKHHRSDEAQELLAILNDKEKDDPQIVSDVVDIEESVRVDADPEGHSKNPFARTANKHLQRTLLAIGVNMMAQLSGINVITFYSVKIFEEYLGYTAIMARIISGCLQLWQVCTAGMAVIIVDHFGRRKLLLAGFIGMSVCHAALAGLGSDFSNTSAASASVFFIFLTMVFFPIGLFLIPFMYAAEVAPIHVRSQVTAMSACVNWLFNFLLAEITPIGFNNIGNLYYVIYACVNFVSFWVVLFFFPETKGRTLEEIDDIFIQSDSPLKTVKVARALPMRTAMNDEILQTIHEKGSEENIEIVETAYD